MNTESSNWNTSASFDPVTDLPGTFDIVTDFRIGSGSSHISNLFVRFNYVDDQNYYYVRLLGGGGREIWLYRFVDGVGTLLGSTVSGFSLNTVNELKIQRIERPRL